MAAISLFDTFQAADALTFSRPHAAFQHGAFGRDGRADGTAPHTTVWWARRPSDRYRAMFRQRIVLLNKPFRVLSQFTDKPAVGSAAQPSTASTHAARETLSEYIAEPPSGIGRLRPAGRLDYDSEGLLVLTEDRQLQQRGTDKVTPWQCRIRLRAARDTQVERPGH